MALDTYSDLQTAILSWLARPGDPLVSPAVPDLIRLFEREANRRLKVGAAEKRAQLHALSAGVDLPQDFGELRLATSGGVNLSYVPPMQLPNLGGMPGHYTIIGNALYLGPSPSGEAFVDIIYQSGVPPLSDANPTNWLLTRHPDCYLFGSLVEAEAYIGHDERISLWAARLQAAFESIESADRKARWNGSPLQIRADGMPGAGNGSAAGDWSGAPPQPIPITGVFAGTGLTGGGTEGAVTLSLGVPVPVSLGGSGATTPEGAPWAGRVVTDAVAPLAPKDGDLWWDTNSQQLFLWYDNGLTGVWEPSTEVPGPAGPPGPLGPPGETAADQLSGILVPYYLAPTGDAYADTNVQRLLGLMRLYHDVPVMVVINPASGPGTFSAFYASLIKLLQAAGGVVLGYVATGFGTRAESAVKADIDLWQSLYSATPVNGIFLDEMPWDTGPGNVGSEYVDRYKMYTDYCHAAGLTPTVGNPGTNQQPQWFATHTADVIVVHEDLTWPSEASMQGNYAGGHADYSYERRAALVYNQATLDTVLLTTLRKNVQWVYVTHDNLTAGALNPWDTLPTYLEQLFSAISPTNIPNFLEAPIDGQIYGRRGSDASWQVASAGGGSSLVPTQDVPPPTPSDGTLWWDSVGGQLYIWFDDASADPGQWVAASNYVASVDWNTLTNKPATFPPTVPIAWTDVSGKPVTFPPTLPIAQSGVTGLTTDLAAAQNNVGRNLIHNPLFNIAQRPLNSTTSGYTVDRWRQAMQTDTTAGASRAALTDADRAAIGDEAAIFALHHPFVGNAAAGSYFQISHPMEDVRRLAGKTITVSFWARYTAGTPQLGVSWSQVFGSGGSPSATVSGTGVARAITGTWARYSVTFNIPSVAGKTLGTNGMDLFQLEFWLSSSTTYATRSAIGVQTGTVQLWGVQLEVGSTMTPLEKPDPANDFAICQRFYQTGTVDANTIPAAVGTISSQYSFPVVMRTVPTITFNVQGSGNAGAPSAVALARSLKVYWSVTATAGGSYMTTIFTASADL